MWPFQRKARDKDKVVPPVDLNTAVTNPRLVAAIEGFSAAQGPRELNVLLSELRRSVFLVAAFMEKAQLTNRTDSGQATIAKDSEIGILEVEGPTGERTLPLFSDWDAIRKFTDRRVSTLVMPAAQAWKFAAKNYGAAVVNPAGPALPLDREQINELARTSP